MDQDISKFAASMLRMALLKNLQEANPSVCAGVIALLQGILRSAASDAKMNACLYPELAPDVVDLLDILANGLDGVDVNTTWRT